MIVDAGEWHGHFTAGVALVVLAVNIACCSQ